MALASAARTQRVVASRRPRGLVAVRGLAVTMVFISAGLTIVATRMDQPRTPFTIPWPLLAVLFLAGEVLVVNVRFRREAHVIGMGEIALALGLIFVAAPELVAAQLLGRAVIFIAVRRMAPLKVGFNLAHFSLGTVVAVVVDRAVLGGADALSARGMVAVLLAALSASLVGAAAVAGAVVLTEGSMDRVRMTRSLFLGVAGAAVNASVGLLGAVILWDRPPAAILLFPPAIALYLGYDAYSRGGRRHEQVALLSATGRSLNLAGAVDDMIPVLLGHARRMFAADHVEIVLLPGSVRDTALGSMLDDTGMVQSAGEEPAAVAALLAEMCGTQAGVLLFADSDEARVATLLRSRGLQRAVTAPLFGEGGSVGALLIGHRAGVGGIGAEDLGVVAALAAHVAIALENGSLERSIERLESLQEQLHHQAYHDSLTGLPNRALFRERVRQALGQRSLDGGTLAVLFIDLDDFKVVNDTLGHAAGDALLLEVGRRLRTVVRESGIVARLGGDEFAVLLEEVDGAAEASNLAEDLVAALDRSAAVPGGQAAARASVGVAIAVAGTPDTETLLRHADVAMYIAKAHGKGRHQLFAPTMLAAVVERHELRADLRQAISRNELMVAYQPIVELTSGRVAAVESLVRWRHPRRNMILPSEFIPIAEENGLILPIGAWVLRTACAQGAQWARRLGDRTPDIAVNLSGRQLQHPAFVEDIADAITSSGIDPRRLVLEITEGQTITDVAGTRAQLQRLRALGVRVALDDFGTGYAALTWLRDLPVDQVKLARELVERLGEGAAHDALAEAVINLARRLGLALVAEGVETAMQRDRLIELGCSHAQGFFFARPSEAEVVEPLLGADLTPARWRSREQAPTFPVHKRASA